MPKNSVGGEVEQVSKDHLLEMFDISVQDKLLSNLNRAGVRGMVVFEVLQMDSSCFGNRSAYIFGPSCTYRTLDEMCAIRLGDVPSRFMYPTHYYLRED